MPKFFRFPWASTGDKTTIPDETDVAGFVSYQQGYGNDYARDPASDPLAKLIERDKMNQLFSDLTENAQYWQIHAFPEYITAAQNGGVDYAYDELAIVRYDSGTGYKVYQNTVAGNTNLPTGAGWVEYKIEAIINAATTKATPVDADEFGYVSETSPGVFELVKMTGANVKAWLEPYFDTLYSRTTAIFGIGQTKQNVTASRAFGTTYTNSTGRPIQFSVTASCNAGGGYFSVVVSGIQEASQQNTSTTTTTGLSITGIVVPDGQTYSATQVGATLTNWVELR